MNPDQQLINETIDQVKYCTRSTRSLRAHAMHALVVSNGEKKVLVVQKNSSSKS
jgi:hypothetical protein